MYIDHTHTQFWLKLTVLRDCMVHLAMIFHFCNTLITYSRLILIFFVHMLCTCIMSFILDSSVNAWPLWCHNCRSTTVNKYMPGFIHLILENCSPPKTIYYNKQACNYFSSQQKAMCKYMYHKLWQQLKFTKVLAANHLFIRNAAH